MKVIKIVCPQCGHIHHDVPAVLKKDPRVEIEISYRLCEGFCKERLKMLRHMAKHMEKLLNKKGGKL